MISYGHVLTFKILRIYREIAKQPETILIILDMAKKRMLTFHS